jgi:hypothetical protein
MIPEETYQQWVVILEEQIRSAVVTGRNTDDAIAAVEQQARVDFSWSPPALQARLKAASEAGKRYREKLDRVSYMQKVAVRFGKKQWYAGPTENADNWNGLQHRLIGISGRSLEDVTTLDNESTTIVSLLDNPGTSKFSTRGLVVGHVQSGKTGNMAAVIAKAADTPFKFFLVLSGMTDTLRHQTQVRLQHDVKDTAAPNRWHLWTTIDTEINGSVVKGEFDHPATGGFAFDNKNQLAVMKKNAGVLRRFLAKLKNTDEATLRNTPFLIIDDECDQASVNSAALQKAVTKINGYIREILARLPRAAYIGYTATPFANVLIDPAAQDDLYPRHFIHALSRPNNYFGAERLFGRAALDGDHSDTEAGVDMIRIVPAGEISKLRPGSGKKMMFTCEVSDSLSHAIRYFVLVTAARMARGQGQEHSSMLVHTSVLNSVHRSTEAAIRPHLADIAARLIASDAKLLNEFAEQWDEEQEHVLAEQFDLKRVPFDRLKEHLSEVASSIEVKVENWSSTNRIDYSVPARRYLIIGGNVLARGLTLEGLSVSFFLRSSSQYDTLMQMGRWFGYRTGFEDLPRIWMEQDVMHSFLDLATVEAEIRKDIRKYAEEEITPEQFGVRIRRIPGMTITAPAKMRTAIPVEIGYAGSHQQTTRFHHNDKDWLESNWRAGEALVNAGNLDNGGRNPVLRAVPASKIIEFLNAYTVHASHRPMAREFLVEYIERSAATDWNVVVVQGDRDSAGVSTRLGRVTDVHKVRRSAMKDSGNEASIKALMSKRDLLTDCASEPVYQGEDSWEGYKKFREEQSMPPLLLLYPIDKKSDPRVIKEKSDREPLNAAHDVLGFAVVFPGAHAKAQVYVSAKIVPEEATEIPEGEDAIPVDVTDTDEGQ